MCTAVSYRNNTHYFGRTLDYERSYGEEIVFTPRNYPLPFRELPDFETHHAILGMAHVEEGYPLYYDAMNEKGLCMAGLNFVGFAAYTGHCRDKVAPFEFIPWVLGQCETVAQVKVLLTHTALTETDFSQHLPAARLHWLIADQDEAITVESMADGLHIYENPAGVLTNNPPFPEQMRHLTSFSHLSPQPPVNHFPIEMKPISRGMGAMGLPGDLSSPSRFVRVAFTNLHSLCDKNQGLSQFFHIIGSVEQVKGCCRLEDGSLEHTIYTSCCDTARGIYYYTTYGNRRICGIDMNREDFDGNCLQRYPLLTAEDILLQN